MSVSSELEFETPETTLHRRQLSFPETESKKNQNPSLSKKQRAAPIRIPQQLLKFSSQRLQLLLLHTILDKMTMVHYERVTFPNKRL